MICQCEHPGDRRDSRPLVLDDDPEELWPRARNCQNQSACTEEIYHLDCRKFCEPDRSQPEMTMPHFLDRRQRPSPDTINRACQRKGLRLGRYDLDLDTHMHIGVQLHGHRVDTHRANGFVQLDLSTLDLQASLCL